MRVSRVLCLVAFAAFAFAGSARASIIFDNFNTNEGHFNQLPTFSSTTNFTTASTADRITTDSFEGAGSESLVLVHSTATTNRCRFVSGNGTPSNNPSFPITAGTDGKIGYYYKVAGTLANASGTTMSLILDDAAADGAAGDDMGTPKPINADGAWHLVEWDLDVPGDWAVATGLGGDGILTVGTNRTIDSLYFQLNNAASGSQFSLLVDFVAKSDSGSIAALIPEPATLGMLLLAPALMLRRRRS